MNKVCFIICIFIWQAVKTPFVGCTIDATGLKVSVRTRNCVAGRTQYVTSGTILLFLKEDSKCF